MIDANKSTTQRSSKLRGWLSDMDLVDPITLRHGTSDQPASVPTGSTRINYILISHPLYPYIQAARILPFHHVFHSDHRPLFIDIELDAFLLGVPNARLSSTTRGICSNNPKAAFLARSNIEHRICRISTITVNKRILNSRRDTAGTGHRPSTPPLPVRNSGLKKYVDS